MSLCASLSQTQCRYSHSVRAWLCPRPLTVKWAWYAYGRSEGIVKMNANIFLGAENLIYVFWSSKIKSSIEYVWSDLIAVVTMINAVFLDMIIRGSCRKRRFGGMYYHVYHGFVVMVVWLITRRGFGLDSGFIRCGDLQLHTLQTEWSHSTNYCKSC
jgi:hypothetical protein